MKWLIACGVGVALHLRAGELPDTVTEKAAQADGTRPTVELPVGTTHMKAAEPVQMTIVWITGILALVCLGAGIYALVSNAKAKTIFRISGFSLTTGSVGVALVGVGLVLGYLTFRDVLRNTRELAQIPEPMPQVITNSSISAGGVATEPAKK